MATVSYSWNQDFDFLNRVLNSVTAGDQTVPAVAALPDGNFVAAWNDPEADGNVRGHIFTPAGDRAGNTDFLFLSGVQENASLAAFGQGRWIVAFTDKRNDPAGDIGHFAVGPSDLGHLVDGASADGNPDVIGLADGGLALTWTRGASDVMRKVFNADLSVRAAEAAVDGGTNGSQPQGSSVAALAGGGFVVAFHELYFVTSFSDRTLFRRYDANGNALDALPVIFDAAGSVNRDVQVLGLQDGGFVVAYTDNEHGAGADIHVRIYNEDGTQRIDLGRINNFFAGDQNKPTLALLSNGYFVVGWQNQGGLKVQAFDPNGNEAGIESDQGGMIDAEIVGLANGRLVNVRSSTASDTFPAASTSIRASAFDLVRTTTADDSGETLIGDELMDIMIGGAGIDSAVFSGARAAYALTNLGGGNVRVVGPDGSDMVSAVEKLVFDDATLNWQPTNGNDFNADAFGDILWRNADNGQVTTWELDGAGGMAADVYGATNLAWQQIAANDFNADGKGDILWRNNTTGQVATWELNGAGGFAFDSYGAANLAWQSVGTGDFNADGKGDVLFRNTNTGQVATWELDGADGFAFDSYGAANLAWKIAGIGDFNEDGRDDILWRNSSTGQVATWELNGSGGFAFDSYGAANLVWHVYGVGDFNADGRDDILFRNDSGQVATWELNGSGGIGVDIYGAANAQWSIMHATDTNSDGKDDILWRNTSTGQVAAWELDGAGGFSFQGYGSNTLDWQIFDGNFQFV